MLIHSWLHGSGTEAETQAEADTSDTSDPLASILDDTPITINSYLGLHSIIFNQSKLGYYLDRGGYNFWMSPCYSGGDDDMEGYC